jgi:hypothetical protein
MGVTGMTNRIAMYSAQKEIISGMLFVLEVKSSQDQDQDRFVCIQIALRCILRRNFFSFFLRR